ASNPTQADFLFDPREALAALADPRALTYQPDPHGLRLARDAVAGYYAGRGVRVDPQQVFLTASTSEAYSYLFRLLADPGHRVLVPRPSYPLFEYLARLDDVELTPYPLAYHQEWRIDFDGLRAGLAGWSAGRPGARSPARAVLLVHPNNPTGSFVHQSELAPLVSLAAGHGVALIADEVFADYAFEARPSEDPPVPSFGATTGVLTFTLSGLSKLAALPQMKLAWIVASGPADALQAAIARLEVIADTYLSVSAPLAHALPRWLEMGTQMRARIMERVQGNLRRLDEQMARTPGTPVSRLATEGGWYAILRVPATRPDEDWAVELVRQDGVLVHPGHFYDFPRDGYLVVSLLPPPDAFERGVGAILARLSA
ncbi:MAG TPA: pyridoxal phosphate-dependent aminotransferase, partial [Terriglobia bacterium]|nr:pyridoxal phosphate-dependent aminotransferase [Terriglobia bacterium]